MTNPLTSPAGSGDRVLVETGQYRGTLKSVTTKEFPELDDQGAQTDKMVTKLMFIFELDEPKNAYATKMTSTSTWCKKGTESGLIKLLRELDFIGLSKANKDSDVIYNKDALWILINDLVGRRFTLNIENNGRYNNYVSGSPITGDSIPAPKLTPKQEMDKVLGNDDINF